MRKIILLTFFFGVVTHYYTSAQICDTFPFQHVYYNKGYQNSHVKSVLFNKNSDMYFIGSVSVTTAGNSDAWLMAATFHGTPLWSKAIGTSANEDVVSFRRTDDGGFLLAGNTNYNSLYEVPWLAKIDSAGNSVWSIKLNNVNGSLSQLNVLNNGDIVAVGSLYLKFTGDGKGNIEKITNSCNFIMRVDNNGRLLWQRSFYHSDQERLNKVQQISDGNLIALGNVIDGTTGYILKLNENDGQLIWMNEYKTSSYSFGHFSQSKDGSFRFTTGNRTYFLTEDGQYKNGTTEINLLSNNVTLKNVPLSDFGSPSAGNEIYFANIKPNPVLFNVNNGEVAWAYTYHSNNKKGLALSSGSIYRNNIYLSGGYNTDKISDTSLNDNAAYLLKATIHGITECSDTFKIAFKISPVETIANTSYTWTDAGMVDEEYIPLYSKSLMPASINDCAEFTCCTDVTKNLNAQMCKSGMYKLVDGTIATQPGYYTSRYTTTKGCDSIIYTNLTITQKINLNLNDDTCLVNNIPVTYNLNSDTIFHYKWQDGTTGSKYTINYPGKYWVTAFTACNAVVDTVNVHDACDEPVYIPSAFTPNGDGLNDVFKIPGISAQHLSAMNIYNRYGQLIFHTADINKGWDGTLNGIPQPSGTYVYFISYYDFSGKAHNLKGTIIILR